MFIIIQKTAMEAMKIWINNLTYLFNKGQSEGEAGLIQKFIKNGNMTVEQIAAIIKLPVEKVRQLAEMNLTTA